MSNMSTMEYGPASTVTGRVDPPGLGLWSVSVTAVYLLVLYFWRLKLRPVPTLLRHGPSSVTLDVLDGQHGGTTLLELLERRVPSLFKPFTPAWWLPGGNMQTFYCSLGDFSQVDPIHYERKFFRSPDGGLFTVDITPPFSERPYSAGEPVLIILHGLTGGSHESYVRSVLTSVTPSQKKGGLGMRGVVLNFRGCAGSPVLSKKLYHAGSTEDLRSTVLWLSKVMPESSLFGLGFSMGSNVLVKYCAEEGDACPLTAAISLANIWDYFKAGRHIECGTFINRYVYDFVLGDALRNLIRTNSHAFVTETRFSVPDLLRRPLVRMRYYCDIVNSQLGGFKDADDYYTQVSSTQFIGRVRTPTLAVNARDDPISCMQNLPLKEIEASEWFVMAITGGGHMGWFEAGARRWYVKPIREFLSAFLDAKLKPRPRPTPLPPTETGMVLQDGREDVGYSEVTRESIPVVSGEGVSKLLSGW